MSNHSQSAYYDLWWRIDFSVLDGTQFQAGHFFEGIDADESAYLYIHNPEESGVALLTSPPTFRSDSRVNVRVDYNPTEDTQGTDASIKEKSTDSDESVVEARYGGDYTSNDPFAFRPLGGGRGAQAFGGSDDDTAFAVASGDGVLLEAVARNSDTDVTLTLEWAELPETVINID